VNTTTAQHRIGAPLPGFRRYRCGACHYQYETFGYGAPAPDECGLCGWPWVAVSETVGWRDLQRVPDVREL